MEVLLIVIAVVSAIFFFSLYAVYSHVISKTNEAMINLEHELRREISFQANDLDEMEEGLSHVFEVFEEYEGYISAMCEEMQMSRDSRFFELLSRTKMVRDMLRSILEKEIPNEDDAPRAVAKVGTIKAG